MKILRRTLLAVLGSMLFAALLLGVWVQVGQNTIGRRDTVKGWLQESGFYDKIVDVVLENAEKSAESEGQQLPLDDPQIKSVAASAFNPAFLQESIEEVLTGVYAWLDGETSKPQFSVDLGPAKQQLADGIGNYAASRAAALPACTQAQLQELDTNNLDILTVPCLPPGVDPGVAAADLRNQILTDEDFMGDTTLTGDDVKIESDGEQTSVENDKNLARLQDAYEKTKRVPLIAGIIALLCVAGIIFLSSERMKGVRRAGIVLASAGLALGIGYVFIKAGSKLLRERATNLSGSSTASQELASGIADTIGNDIAKHLGWYALGIGLLGLVLVLVSILVRRQRKQPDTTSTSVTNEKSREADSSQSTHGVSGKNTDATPEEPKRKEPPKIQL